MQKIKKLFKDFFKVKYIKQYLIITVLYFTSPLIIPAFPLFGYIVNSIKYAGKGTVFEVTKEKGLFKLTKEGLFFLVFFFLISIVIQPIVFLVGSIISLIIVNLFSTTNIPVILIVILFFAIILTVLIYSLLVSYAKNRSMVAAFSSGDFISYLKNPKFYVYTLVSFFILIVFSITVIGIGIGIVFSYSILGLVIEED